jgi:hypothetical protein
LHRTGVLANSINRSVRSTERNIESPARDF